MMRVTFMNRCWRLCVVGAAGLVFVVVGRGAMAAEEGGRAGLFDLNYGAVAFADDAAMGGGEEGMAGAMDGMDGSGRRLRSWEMPEVEVVGVAPSMLKQEERIGSYGQPRWTAHRRFPTTRVYVRPEGMVEAEYHLRVKRKRGGDTTYEHRQELEIGLGHRLQLDIYLIETHDDEELTFDPSLELRYALADWGELPGNPTLYFEYQFREARSDKIETKLLLGGELAPRWHWGTNLVWEQELGDAEETVFEVTQGLSYSITEQFAVGAEAKFEVANEKGDRGTWGENLRLGPSFQWSPTERFHVDIAPLFGLTNNSSVADIFFVMGFEF